MFQHVTLQWCHNERVGVSNHQPRDCLLNRLFKAQIKENIKARRHWSLCGEFTGDRWISRTKGQWHGKYFHLMTSSWSVKSGMLVAVLIWRYRPTSIGIPIIKIGRSHDRLIFIMTTFIPRKISLSTHSETRTKGRQFTDGTFKCFDLNQISLSFVYFPRVQ